jgi:hypothetical protein
VSVLPCGTPYGTLCGSVCGYFSSHCPFLLIVNFLPVSGGIWGEGLQFLRHCGVYGSRSGQQVLVPCNCFSVRPLTPRGRKFCRITQKWRIKSVTRLGPNVRVSSRKRAEQWLDYLCSTDIGFKTLSAVQFCLAKTTGKSWNGMATSARTCPLMN